MIFHNVRTQFAFDAYINAGRFHPYPDTQNRRYIFGMIQWIDIFYGSVLEYAGRVDEVSQSIHYKCHIDKLQK